ncbi:MAG: RNA polymerase sigma-70 factor [Bacteroidales bacterium]
MAFKDIKFQRATRNDDISAFEKLFRMYYAELVNYAYGFLKDRDASEEIVQELFYNYWKNRKKTDIRFSVRSYLYRSVRNNSLKYLDSLAVRRRYADRVLEREKENTGFESTEMELSELSEIINATLSELPERCSRIFRMSRYEGMKYEEIASFLSVSVKTVEADMTKALKLLRKRLGKYYESSLP